MKRKVLVIGIDGADWDLILPWVRKGKLPNFKRLLGEGGWGKLESVPNVNSPAAWGSFSTGVNPGRHGLFDFYRRKEGTYEIEFINGGELASSTIWEIASKAGKRVGVVNLPMSYPAGKVKGVIVAGIDAPSIKSKGFCYPESFKKKLEELVGEYTIELDVSDYFRRDKLSELEEEGVRTIQKRYKVARYLLKNENPDLLITIFTVPDRFHHFFIDKKRVILKIYKQLDDILDKFLKCLGEEWALIVVSDHGAGKYLGGQKYLRKFLIKTGLFSQEKEGLLKRTIKKGGEVVDGFGISKLRKTLWAMWPSLKGKTVGFYFAPGANWLKTKAYTFAHRTEVFINLKGREPQGVVEKKDYEKVRGKIIRLLKKVRDLKTGRGAVKKVHRREEIYWGPYVRRAPDLTVDWREGEPFSGFLVEDKKLGRIEIEKPRLAFIHRKRGGWRGDHRRMGIYLFWGKGIKGGKFGVKKIYDMAPTILKILGVKLEKKFDGKVIVEALPKGNL